MTLVPALTLSFGAYFFLDKNLQSSLFIFLGLYCLLAVFFNKKMLPYFESYDLETLK